MTSNMSHSFQLSSIVYDIRLHDDKCLVHGNDSYDTSNAHFYNFSLISSPHKVWWTFAVTWRRFNFFSFLLFKNYLKWKIVEWNSRLHHQTVAQLAQLKISFVFCHLSQWVRQFKFAYQLVSQLRQRSDKQCLVILRFNEALKGVSTNTHALHSRNLSHCKCAEKSYDSRISLDDATVLAISRHIEQSIIAPANANVIRRKLFCCRLCVGNSLMVVASLNFRDNSWMRIKETFEGRRVSWRVFDETIIDLSFD